MTCLYEPGLIMEGISFPYAHKGNNKFTLLNKSGQVKEKSNIINRDGEFDRD